MGLRTYKSPLLYYIVLLGWRTRSSLIFIIIRSCKWNLKQSPFRSAKLSIGDIMATEMHASDAYTMIQLCIKVEIDRNSVKHVLGLINILSPMHA